MNPCYDLDLEDGNPIVWHDALAHHNAPSHQVGYKRLNSLEDTVHTKSRCTDTWTLWFESIPLPLLEYEQKSISQVKFSSTVTHKGPWRRRRRRRRRINYLIHETSDLFGTGDKSTSFVGAGDELVNAGVILIDVIPLSKASSQVHHGVHGDSSLNCFIAAMESAQHSVSNMFSVYLLVLIGNCSH